MFKRDASTDEVEDLIKKVRKIQMAATHLVDEALSGGYVSAFRGSGMEFDEVRSYQPGDDIRSIDWNVTARSGDAYIKRFIEERELRIMILVDGSSSSLFGSTGQSKIELASEIAAVLAFSAIANKDRVGLILFTDKIDFYLPPRSGKDHVLRLIREILKFRPKRAETNLNTGLEFLARIQRKRTTSFLISDFIDSGFDQTLNLASRRHDIIPIRITDPHEEALPNLGLIRVEDAETGEQKLIDTSGRKRRLVYQKRTEAQAQELKESFQKRDLDQLYLKTGEEYLIPMKQLFKRRERKRR